MKKKWQEKWQGYVCVGLILVLGLTFWGLSATHQPTHQPTQASLTVQEKTDYQLDAFDKSVQNFKSSIDVMWSSYKKERNSDQSPKWTHNVTLMQKQAVKVQSEYTRCQKIKNMNPTQKARFQRISNEMQHQLTRSVENNQ